MPARHARFVFCYLPLCSALLLASPVQAQEPDKPVKHTQPIKVSSNIAVPLSEVRALTPEEVYESHIATMYKTTSRVNQEVAARSLLQRNPNVITEDFRFIEAVLQNSVAYDRINRLVDNVRKNNSQLDKLSNFLYKTYQGVNTMTPENELKGFNALIYTLYRDDKRYSANGGNNAEMAGLQAKQLHIYQNGSKEEREALFAGLKTVFDGMDKRDKTNVQVVAKALFKNMEQALLIKYRNSKQKGDILNIYSNKSDVIFDTFFSYLGMSKNELATKQ